MFFFYAYFKGVKNMGGRGASFDLNSGERNQGNIREPADFEPVEKSENPFKPFKTYQKEFYNTKNIDELQDVLDKNGVSINSNLYRDVKSGNLSLNEVKEFMKGALLVVSHQGDNATFRGFGSVNNSRAVAFYSPKNNSIHIVKSNFKKQYSSIGNRKVQTNKSIGAHEAMHHTQFLLQRQKINYSDKVVRDSLKKLKQIEPKNKTKSNRSYAKEKISKISSYAWKGGNDETISEAMNDVITNGARATNLSKIIYKQIKKDTKKYGIR